MVLPTKMKLRIARLLHRLVVGSRSLAGLSPIVRTRRNGSLWELDLNEGIDLAIFLGLYQKLPKALLARELKPGACVLDIGANIGAHALPLAGAVGLEGQVVAIEPTAYAYGKLKRNLELNGIPPDRVVAVQCALNDGSGRQDGAQEFYSRWPLDKTEDGFHAQHGGMFEAAAGARFTSLDALLSDLRRDGLLRGTIAFAKIDVDGHELDVLKGAQKFLSEDRPVLLMEVAPHIQDEIPGRFEALVEILHDCGFRFVADSDGKPVPDSAEGLRNLIPYGASIDAVLRPAG